MFADIRGFTGFVEAVLPYDVIHVLQRQLRDVTSAIERYGGVVTSYMGDGVMALFRHDDPSSTGPASRRAVRAGLEILADADAADPASRNCTAGPSTSTSASTSGRRSSARCSAIRRRSRRSATR